jgi:hypothetical protein
MSAPPFVGKQYNVLSPASDYEPQEMAVQASF